MTWWILKNNFILKKLREQHIKMPKESSALKDHFCLCYSEYEWNFSPQQQVWNATALIQNRNKEVTAFQTKPEFISACALTHHCTGQHLIETMFYIKTIIKNRLKKKAWFFLFPPVIIIILSCTSDWPLTRAGGGGGSLINRRMMQPVICRRQKNTSLSRDSERYI